MDEKRRDWRRCIKGRLSPFKCDGRPFDCLNITDITILYKFMLGGEENPLMYTIYQVVAGMPLGIGALLIYPMARKIGIRNLTIGGYSLVWIGSIIGWMFSDQLIPALIGGFLRNVGWLPNAYIFATLLCCPFVH